MATETLRGLAASTGYGIGQAVLIDHPDLEIPTEKASDPNGEVNRLEQCLKRAEQELEKLVARAKERIGSEQAAIFEAHIMMLKDPTLIDSTKKKITDESLSAPYALKLVSDQYIAKLKASTNPYLRERVTDLQDVVYRVQRHMISPDEQTATSVETVNAILVGEDLKPSQIVEYDAKTAAALVIEKGGVTSHIAILARSMGLPAVMGCKGAGAAVRAGSKVIVDAVKGQVLLEPSENEQEKYQQLARDFEKDKEKLLPFREKPAVTTDNHRVRVAANIGSAVEAEFAQKKGSEGVGLFRTEFLFLDRPSAPSEEEQLKIYRSVLETMKGDPVIIRTLDVGGDKDVAYLNLETEANPFLGVRGLRFCLKNPKVFRMQLRALLRASAFGKLGIMLPMVSSLDEVVEAKALVKDVESELKKENIEVADDYELGIMIEVPSAALIADILAKHVDFFSIGTNDLMQYVFAADRLNENLSDIYDPFHLGLLRLIKNVVEAGHREGIWVGMCGELAGQDEFIPLLLGLGLDELSMSSSSVLKAKKAICESSLESAKELTEKVFNTSTRDELMALLLKNA